MSDVKVTVQETAEDRQAWLEAAEMHRKRADVIDWRRSLRPTRKGSTSRRTASE